jgi:hypothetical protein
MSDQRSRTPHRVDLEFLTHLEGSVSVGYVPTHRRGAKKGEAIGQSGVTVGVGCDLGARCEADLRRLGLADDLVEKLTPYLGKRRREAQEALACRPLRLSDAEAAALSAAVAAEIFDRLAARYDAAVAAVPGARRFCELPWQAQTVIASVAYQYGDNLRRATPRFWAKAVSQDWRAVVDALENFGDAYGPRRRQEAKLLRTMLAGGDHRDTRTPAQETQA